MGQKHFRPCGAEIAQSAAQERYSFGHITNLGFDPASEDRCSNSKEGKALLVHHLRQFVRPLP